MNRNEFSYVYTLINRKENFLYCGRSVEVQLFGWRRIQVKNSLLISLLCSLSMDFFGAFDAWIMFFMGVN